MIRHGILACGVLAGVVVGAGPAWAGWVIDQVMRGGGEGGRMQVLVQANRMKTLMLGPDGRPAMAFIVDLNTETIIQVDFQQRRYTASTIQEYGQVMRGAQQAAAGDRARAMEQMREALKDMPPEQRQAMEQMMRSQMAQAGQGPQECRERRIEVRRTGQQATIAGFSAVRYDVFADGRPESEVWVAPGLTAWRELDPQRLARFAAEIAKIAGCGASAPAGGPLGGDAVWQLAGEGYPVRSVHAGSGTTVEVVKAESRAVPAAEFQPPAGFARKTLQETLGR